jgi:hypothetical protein
VHPKIVEKESEIKAHEYNTTKIKFNLNEMHVIDKIEWHKKLVTWYLEK